jgi:hypothetical protein
MTPAGPPPATSSAWQAATVGSGLSRAFGGGPESVWSPNPSVDQLGRTPLALAVWVAIASISPGDRQS